MRDDSSSDFDINRYRELLWKRRYLAIAVSLAVLSLFTWGGYFWPKSYEVSSTVTIENSGLVNPLAQGIGTSGNQSLMDLRNTITSRVVIGRVIKKLGLDASKKNDTQFEGLIANIQKNLEVTAVQRVGGSRDADLFKISYRGRDPKVVLTTVENLVSEFIEESAGHQRSVAFGAYDFIDEQLNEYRKKLEDSDKATREFRERNPSMVPQNEAAVLGRIESFQTSRIETEIKLKELIRKRDNLQKQLSGEKELTVAFVSNDGSPEGRLNFLNNQLMQLLTKYTENYPDVLKVKSEIEELRKQIAQAAIDEKTGKMGNTVGSETKAINPVYRQIKEEMSRTDTEIETMKARQEELVKQLNEGRAMLGRMPKEQEEWTKLQRDRSAYQRVYDELIQKRESARVSKDLEIADKTTRLRVVDPPVMPRFPVSPNRVKLILLGFFLGICAGVGVAVGLDYIDKSFKDEEEVQKGLRLPVLASIPSIITDADNLTESIRDKKVFVAAATYLSLIALVLVGELAYQYLGITLFRI